MNRVELIADAQGNWAVGDKKKRALTLVDMAAGRGADWICFHLFDHLYRDEAKQAQIDPYIFPVEWLPEIHERTQQKGIGLLLSPYHVDMVQQVKAYADGWFIQAQNSLYTPLVEELATYPKKTFMALSAISEEEATKAAMDIGLTQRENVIIMHSPVGNEPKDMSLRTLVDIPSMLEMFPLMGFEAVSSKNIHLIASTVLYGANAIKVNLDADDGKGIDSHRSLDPSQLLQLSQQINIFLAAKGERDMAVPMPDQMARAEFSRDTEDGLRPARQ